MLQSIWRGRAARLTAQQRLQAITKLQVSCTVSHRRHCIHTHCVNPATYISHQAACDDGDFEAAKSWPGVSLIPSPVRGFVLLLLRLGCKANEHQMTLSCNAAGALERALSEAPVQAASGCPGRPAQRPVPARHHPPARALERRQCHPAEVSDQAKLGLPVQCSRLVQISHLCMMAVVVHHHSHHAELGNLARGCLCTIDTELVEAFEVSSGQRCSASTDNLRNTGCTWQHLHACF